ncbi:Cell differentiation protein rcd1 [Entamoeba marina]
MFPPLSATGMKKGRNKNFSPQPNPNRHTIDKSQKQEKIVPKQEPEQQKLPPTPSSQPYHISSFPDLPENTASLIADLADIEKRSAALDALSLITEKHPDIAIPLWYSYGTIVILLEEIVSVYPYISGKHNETQSVSLQVINKRVCKALALLQTIASHPKTQQFLIKIDIIYFLTPIFALRQNEREIEYLRLTSLGVIGSMSKTRDPQIIKYLIDKEALTICIVSIQYATDISRVIATFILSKLFSDEFALEHACDGQEKVTAIFNLLCKTISNSVTTKKDVNFRLIRYSLDCLCHLSTNTKATMYLHSLVNENKQLFKERLLDYILSKEPNLKPKYDEFCRNINFTQK